jgi:hypothetical protein
VSSVPPDTWQRDAESPHLDQRGHQDAQAVYLSLREPDRFGVIFDRYFAEIHGYVARRIGGDAADDIAADTFLTAFRKRRNFDADRGHGPRLALRDRDQANQPAPTPRAAPVPGDGTELGGAARREPRGPGH